VRLPADEEAHVRAGIEAGERGETRALTREELDRWAETGELPEQIDECDTRPVHRRPDQALRGVVV
jgi:hypothetical protein